MHKRGKGKPSRDLEAVFVANFGSFDGFQKRFTEIALTQFGSGWVWLSAAPSFLGGWSAPHIESTPNQDSPLMYGRMPLLGLDVWEHAYYLKYRNRRAEYVAAWFHVIDWDFVNARYDAVRKA